MKKKVHHFRHKTDTCSYESYIHKIAKRFIKQKFDTCEKFELITQQKRICKNIQSCPFGFENYCFVLENKMYDLKNNGLYDLCQEEQCVLDGRFKADLLITSTKRDNKPLMFEICVTHKSTEEKINSGLPIVEIHLNNEEQIEDLILNPIGHKEAKYGFEYHNFKKKSNNYCNPSDVKIPLSKFTVFYNGKSFFTYSYKVQEDKSIFNCSKLNEFKKDNTQIELALSRFVSEYNLPLYYCYKKKITACYCSLCLFSTDSNNGLVCKLFKSKGTPHYPILEHKIKCEYFMLKKGMAKLLDKKLQNMPVFELSENDLQKSIF